MKKENGNDVDKMNNDLVIDAHSLDKEWLQQPALYMKYGIEWVKAISVRDSLKDSIKVIESQVDMEVRDNPEAYSLSKVTEAAVRSCVEQDERVTEVRQQFLQAKEAADILGIMRDSILQRRDALNNLTQLHITGYYSSTSIPQSKVDKLQQATTKANLVKSLKKA